MVGAIADDLAAAASLAKGGPALRFADFAWRTLDSWSRARRVPYQAEYHLAYLYLRRATF